MITRLEDPLKSAIKLPPGTIEQIPDVIKPEVEKPPLVDDGEPTINSG